MDDLGRPDDIRAHYAAGIADGFHTLAGLTAGVVYGLVSSPGALATVWADRALLTFAWQEGAGLSAAVVGIPHAAIRDFEYEGIDVGAGTPITLMWALGNRDPEIFERPNEFILDREQRGAPTTFGAGSYACPGANLAHAGAHRPGSRHGIRHRHRSHR